MRSIDMLSSSMKEVLVEHCDSQIVPLRHIAVGDGRALGRRNQVINALIVRGMLCLQRETGSCRKFTKITDKGREVLSVILADRADTLQREQFPEFDPNGKRWHGGRGKRLPADAESV